MSSEYSIILYTLFLGMESTGVMGAKKQPQLSEEDLAKIKKILERDDHLRWLLASLAIWIAWLTGVAAATLALVKVLNEWNTWLLP